MATPILMARDGGAESGRDDGPLTRLFRDGAQNLSDAELLCVLFGRSQQQNPVLEMAESLLAAGGGLKALCQKDPQELCAQPGMGSRKAAQISAALELGRRVMRTGETRPILQTPEDIFVYLAPTLCGLQREQFRVLCLNSRNAVVADVQVALGSTTTCHVDPRDVFHQAVLSKASGIILAHNHPSGDPTPSHADLQLTRQLVRCASVFCIRVLDHVVFGDWTYASLNARNELPLPEQVMKESLWHAHGGSR